MAFGQFDIAITGDASKFRTELNKAVVATQQATRQIGAAGEEQANRIERAMSGIGRRIVGTLTGALGVGAIARQLSIAKEKVIDEERSIARLEATLLATGHAAGLTQKDIESLGQSIKSSTVFDDDEIRKASTALLRFRQIQGDVFRQAIQLAPDLASALGTDLATAATTLGKALTDPDRGLRALRDAGLRLSEQTIDLAARFIETGQRGKAMQLVIDELQRSIGGTAQAENKGLYKSARDLARAWDDLQKATGKRLFKDDPSAVNFLTTALEGLAVAISKARVEWQGFGSSGPFNLGLPRFTMEPKPSRDTGVKPINFDLENRFQAEVGQLRQEASEVLEANYKKEQDAFRLRAQSATQFYSAQLSQQRDYLDRLNQQSEFAYNRGNLTVDEFYDFQQKRTQEAFRQTEEFLSKQAIDLGNFANAPSTNQADREKARLDIQRLSLQIDDERFKTTTKLLGIEQQRTLANEALANSYSELAEQVALANGADEKAARLSFSREFRDRRRALERIRDTGGPLASRQAQQNLDDITKLGEIVEKRGALTAAAREYGNVLEDLAVKQAKIDIAAESGALSEIGVLNQRAALAKEMIPLLTKQAEAYERLARATPEGVERDAALSKAAAMRVEIERLGLATDGLARKINEGLGDAFVDAFSRPLDKTVTLRDRIERLGESIVNMLTNIALAEAKTQLFGKGGTFSGVGDLIARFLGGGGGGSTSELIPAIGDAVYASGTNNARGGWSWVGERGPELMYLQSGAKIVPHQQSMTMARGSSRPVVQQTINVLPGATRQTAAQAAAEAGRQQLVFGGRG